jgi:hypothetical protein
LIVYTRKLHMDACLSHACVGQPFLSQKLTSPDGRIDFPEGFYYFSATNFHSEYNPRPNKPLRIVPLPNLVLFTNHSCLIPLSSSHLPIFERGLPNPISIPLSCLSVWTSLSKNNQIFFEKLKTCSSIRHTIGVYPLG